MYDFCFQVAKDVEIAAEVDQPAVTAVDHWSTSCTDIMKPITQWLYIGYIITHSLTQLYIIMNVSISLICITMQIIVSRSHSLTRMIITHYCTPLWK